MSYGHDFDEIQAAVMETARGRWFLAEFASRNRVAETRVLLEAIARLERSFQARPAVPGPAGAAAGIVGDRPFAEAADAIAAARAALAGIGADDSRALGGRLGEALDRLLEKTRAATSDILDAAETIQEAAWTLRERGADPTNCDALDRGATAIHAAGAFHEFAAERLGRVLEALRTVEGLIDVPAASPGAAAPVARSVRRLDTELVADDVAFLVRDPADDDSSLPTRPSRPHTEAPAAAGARAADPEPAAPDDNPRSRAAPALAALAEIDRLDVRERIRLFT